MTDEARRHHYVPACYLKQFAVPHDRHAGKLHVFDRVTGRSWESSPDKSAHERDFYRVDVEGEHPNLAENAYETLESLFAPALSTVCDRGMLPTAPAALIDLLTFVASQAVRTPRIREAQERFYRDTSMLVMHTLGDDKDEFMTRLRKQQPDIPDEGAEDLFSTHLEHLKAGRAPVEMDQTTIVRDSLALTNDILDELTWRCWILGVAPDGFGFVTTDDPVHLQPAGHQIPQHPLWSPGFGDRYTTVVVPLNPRLVLMGLPYSFTARARVRLKPHEVAAMNTDLALSAFRFVYSMSATFPQIAENGNVVNGPTGELIRKETPSFPERMGFFTADAVRPPR